MGQGQISDSVHDCYGCIRPVCDRLTLTHHSSCLRPCADDTDTACDSVITRLMRLYFNNIWAGDCLGKQLLNVESREATDQIWSFSSM